MRISDVVQDTTNRQDGILQKDSTHLQEERQHFASRVHQHAMPEGDNTKEQISYYEIKSYIVRNLLKQAHV